MPEDISLEDLKELFCPIVAKDETEQVKIYQVFEKVLIEERSKIAVEKSIAQNSEKQQPKGWEKWKLPLLALVILQFGLIGWWLWGRGEVSIVEESVTPPSSEELSIEPDSFGQGCYSFDQLEMIDHAYCDTTLTADTIYTGMGRYTLSDLGCIQYFANDTIGTDTICMIFEMAEGPLKQMALVVRIENPLEENLTEESSPPSKFSLKSIPKTIDVRTLAVDPSSQILTIYVAYEPWIKGGSMFLLGLILWGILQYWELKRRKLIAEMETSNKPPYIWNIQIEDLEPIEVNEHFEAALHQLRQRTKDDIFKLDLHKTIESTVAQGGMTSFQYLQPTRPPEYLLLIDSHSIANHRARLFNHLYEILLENEIHVSRFFYRGDARIVFNEQYPDGIHLRDLQNRYGNARLLILGTGYQMLDPKGRRLGWTEFLTQWKQRALLTPQPLQQWSLRERQLGDLFQLLPATLQGLQFLVNQLDLGEEASPEHWYGKITDAQLVPLHLEQSLLESLRQQYDEPLLQWIAACAIFPSLHWDLTRYLGQYLSTPDNHLLSIENLAQLNRLPWFVQGHIPKEARMVLLDYLEQTQPQLLLGLRQALHHLLETNQPPSNSAAWDDYRMSMALNEWLFTKDKTKKKALEKEIAQKLESGVEPDFAVVKHLEREQSPLDFIIPDSWKKYLFQAGYPGLGYNKTWKGLLKWGLPIWVLSTIGIWQLPTPNITECNNTILYTTPEKTYELCLENAADSLLWWEHLTRQALEAAQYAAADSIMEVVLAQNWLNAQLVNDPTLRASHTILQQVLEASFQEGETPLDSFRFKDLALYNYAHTIGYAYYNLGSTTYDDRETLNPEDSLYALLEDGICHYFQQANRLLFGKDADVALANNWCIDSLSDFITIKGLVVDSLSQAPLANIPFVLGDGRIISTDENGRYSFNMVDSRPMPLSLNFNLFDYKDHRAQFTFYNAIPEFLPTIQLVSTIQRRSGNRAMVRNGQQFGDITFYQSADDPNTFYYMPLFEMAYFDDGKPKMGIFTEIDCNVALVRSAMFYAKAVYNPRAEIYNLAFKALGNRYPNAKIGGPVSGKLQVSLVSSILSDGSNFFSTRVIPTTLNLADANEIIIVSSLTLNGYQALKETFKPLNPFPDLGLEVSNGDSLYYTTNIDGVITPLIGQSEVNLALLPGNKENMINLITNPNAGCLDENRLFSQMENAINQNNRPAADRILAELLQARQRREIEANIRGEFFASNNDATGVRLVADNVLSEAINTQGYQIRFYRSPLNEDNFVRIGETSTGNFIDVNAVPGVTYEYKAQLIGSGMEPFFLKTLEPVIGSRLAIVEDEIFWVSPDPDENNGKTIEVRDREVDIKVMALSDQALFKENFSSKVNGRRPQGQKMDESTLSPPNNFQGRNRQTYSSKVRLEEGLNEIEIIYVGEDGNTIKSQSRTLTINYIPKDKPNLYVLSIGVPSDNVEYTVKDAKDFATTYYGLKDNNGQSFKKVDIRQLLKKKETEKINIQKAFRDIRNWGIKDGDLVVVFISSQGKLLNNHKYALIPSDFDPKYEEITSIDFREDILNPLRAVEGNKLLLIDACFASMDGIKIPNEVDVSVVLNDLIKSTAGMAIITSNSDHEVSFEDSVWQNGAFTEALLEAFRNETVEVNGEKINADKYNYVYGRKESGGDNIITIDELVEFVQKRVPYLVKTTKDSKQNPSYKSTNEFQKNIPIYILDKN